MRFNPDIHHRQSIRLRDFDYGSAGAYFVTVVTQSRECLFGGVVDGVMRPNVLGLTAIRCWFDVPHHFPTVSRDAFVIMPNHMHGIIWITQDHVGARHASPLPDRSIPTIGTIVGSYKSAVTNRINIIRQKQGIPVWQRNYWERIIRDDGELNRIRQYIVNNPANWETDDENPKRKSPPR